MYIPERFRETDREQLQQLIAEYPFGTLVTLADGRPFASHLPFIMDGDRLLCHLAKANPQCGHLGKGKEALCIFQGAHAYVSPSWYHSAGVPTWNYAVVHVYGTATIIDRPSELACLVERFTHHFEAGKPDPWEPDYNHALLSAIVGVSIQITELQGKFKLSQNRQPDDRANVIARLEAAGDPLSLGIARLMRNDAS
jgi:transcriptional regulator